MRIFVVPKEVVYVKLTGCGFYHFINTHAKDGATT